jgi:signal transduction histidine kinase
MTQNIDKNVRTRPFLRLAIGIVIIFTLSLWAFYLVMQPPMNEIWLMAVFLSITAILSALASYAAYKLGWFYRSPTIRWSLILGYVLASLLTFVNVWMTARLMFASQHDLILATILLGFAGGIAIAIGIFISTALTDRIRELDQAAQSIASGNLDTRISYEGQDEIADLSKSFNQMADQLQVAANKQKETERLRRDLIAWVSHDLQTPLTSIRAILEALADGIVDDPATIQRYLRTAQKDVASLSLLIDDLFQLAQLDAGGLQLEVAANSITDLVSDTLESFSTVAARKEIELVGKVEPGVDPVWMDAQRIGRVLNNLVGNAVQYTPSRGRVEVEVTRENNNILVRVKDTGEGIPPEDIQLIFDRFYRGEKSRNRATGGAGLGLAIARGIVEAHGGEIGVTSIPESGTCFSFTLPREQGFHP